MRSFFFIIIMSISMSGFAQSIDSSQQVFLGKQSSMNETERAKKLAYSGNYAESISILKAISNPEAQQLLSRVYAWASQYEKSIKISDKLIAKFPEVVSNYQIAATTSLWGRLWLASYQYALEGLKHDGDELTFRTLQIKSLIGAKKWTEAKNLCQNTLVDFPNDKPLQELLIRIEKELYQKEVILNHTQDYFSLDKSYWKNTSFIFKNRTQYGPLLFSANHSNRFNLKGLQGEIEFYPKLDSNYSAYIDLGFSNSTLFPNFRNGVSIFRTFQSGYELELGYRNMKYNSTGNVWFYLGSVTKYLGSYGITYRFTSINSPEGNSSNQSLKITRYLQDELSTVSLEIGSGTNARDFQAYNSIKPFSSINSRRVQVNYKKYINHKVSFSMITAYENAFYRENQQGKRITFGLGLSRKF